MTNEFDLPDRASVEFFVRAPTGGTRPQQESVVARLQRLERAGTIADFDWYLWNREVCRSSPADQTVWSGFAVEKFYEFERWADEHGRTLHPFFNEYTVSSAITGEEYEMIVFPVMCFALYDDGTLRELAPSGDGDHTVTVHDCLSALER